MVPRKLSLNVFGTFRDLLTTLPLSTVLLSALSSPFDPPSCWKENRCDSLIGVWQVLIPNLLVFLGPLPARNTRKEKWWILLNYTKSFRAHPSLADKRKFSSKVNFWDCVCDWFKFSNTDQAFFFWAFRTHFMQFSSNSEWPLSSCLSKNEVDQPFEWDLLHLRQKRKWWSAQPPASENIASSKRKPSQFIKPNSQKWVATSCESTVKIAISSPVQLSNRVKTFTRKSR